MSDRNPETVRQELNACRERIQTGAVALQKAIREKVDAEIEYDQEFIKADLNVYYTFTNANPPLKLPSAELRRSLALDAMGHEPYAKHLKTKANAEAIQARLKAEYAIASALQSELSSLRVEYSHA